MILFSEPISKNAGPARFDTVLTYMNKIYNLYNSTEKLQGILLNIMPFFRLPVHALEADLIPDTCFNGQGREIFNIQSESLAAFGPLAHELTDRYSNLMSDRQSVTNLSL